MKTLSILNLKGGVGKSITAINFAHILAAKYQKRVLLIDNDKQANTSRFYSTYSQDGVGTSELLTRTETNAAKVIQKTAYSGLDIIPANMSLAAANMAVYADIDAPRVTRIRDALAPVSYRYDYCIIDNAPDVNIGTWNALAASDDYIIPVKIDNAAFDGITDLLHLIEEMRTITPEMRDIRLAGVLITMARKSNINKQGRAHLREICKYPVLDTEIRDTVKVAESTYIKKPLLEYAMWCSASQDYVHAVQEYLSK